MEKEKYSAELILEELALRNELEPAPAIEKLIPNSQMPTQSLEGEGMKESAIPQVTPFDPLRYKQPGKPLMINQYEIFEQVGRGGMGAVYRSFDHNLSRHVAIKLLHSGITIDPRLRHRFAVEGKALAKLEHSNIVPVYEAGEWGETPFYTMKFIAGGTLASRSAELRKDLPTLMRIMVKVARAVDFLHANGVTHRDLKPANILIGEHDEPLVADFGLAKFHDAGMETLTNENSFLGTRFYMSPEQTLGANSALTPACDIWALGVILYEVAAGQYPFNANEIFELFRVIRKDPPAPIVTHKVPQPQLDLIVGKCLEKNPLHRYANGEALARDLERWLAGQPVEAKPAPAPAPTLPPAKRRRPLIAVGAAVAASIAVAIAFGGRRDPEPSPVPAPNTLIPVVPEPAAVLMGETGMPAKWSFVAPGDFGMNEQGICTLDSKGYAVVSLGEASYPQGMLYEIHFQQTRSHGLLPFAGAYCNGVLWSTPAGPVLHCTALHATTMPPPVAMPRPAAPLLTPGGLAEMMVSRWDASGKPPWSYRSLVTPLLMGQASGPAANDAPVCNVRLEIAANRSMKCSMNGAPLSPLSAESQSKNLAIINAFGPKPPNNPTSITNDIGFFVEACQARFWSVLVRPLPVN